MNEIDWPSTFRKLKKKSNLSTPEICTVLRTNNPGLPVPHVNKIERILAGTPGRFTPIVQAALEDLLTSFDCSAVKYKK